MREAGTAGHEGSPSRIPPLPLAPGGPCKPSSGDPDEQWELELDVRWRQWQGLKGERGGQRERRIGIGAEGGREVLGSTGFSS